jgi:hypothetical protein
VRAISHRAQAHELFILAKKAKNVDDEALMRKRKHTSYPLAIVRKHTSYYVDDEILRARDGDNINNGNDDDECRRQGLGHERPAFSYHIAQRRRRQQLLATTNNECRMARPRARAHSILSMSSAHFTRQT